MKAFSLLVWGLVVSLLWGCSVMPDTVRNEALPPLPLSELIRDADKYLGETVIMGGYVIEVENKADHTRMVVVQAPLGSGDKPRTKDHSQGRLILIHDGFIDPEVYTKDRLITVGGKITGSSASEPAPPYPYLELRITDLHLWPEPEPYRYPYWEDDFYHYPWWWRHPYRHHPYWRH